MFTDTHCHVYKEYYDNIAEVIENAELLGVNRLINNGCDSDSNKEVIALAINYSNVYAAIGIPPESVESYKNADIEYSSSSIFCSKGEGFVVPWDKVEENIHCEIKE